MGVCYEIPARAERRKDVIEDLQVPLSGIQHLVESRLGGLPAGLGTYMPR